MPATREAVQPGSGYGAGGSSKANILHNWLQGIFAVLGSRTIARWVWSSDLTSSHARTRASDLGVARRRASCSPVATATEISLAHNAKANQPVPPKLVAAMAEKDTGSAVADPDAPVQAGGRARGLEAGPAPASSRCSKTYPICRWSGDLGPKVREGDRQAPEGFYSINPSQMNPQSAYYLSFNTGYPNAFDKSLGRTGSQLMVHGDCSSRGCYAMTDEQIAEIYSLGREILLRRPEGVPAAGLSVPDDRR